MTTKDQKAAGEAAELPPLPEPNIRSLLSDPNVISLAYSRCGSGLYAKAGSMADDLGRLAAGVIALKLVVDRLYQLVVATIDARDTPCPGGPLCIDQHSVNCPSERAREAVSAVLGSWDGFHAIVEKIVTEAR